MKISFRTDASLRIGSGHVMRCLTLAEVLRSHGATCNFICRHHPGNLLDTIHHRGFSVTELPNIASKYDFKQSVGVTSNLNNDYSSWLGCDWQTDAAQTASALSNLDPDWLVTDHYALNQSWEERISTNCQKLMVIDDLADRTHTCDLLLDQSLDREQKEYNKLVPAKAKVLTGSRYAVLRSEFASLRDYSLQRRAKFPHLRRILISMGGVDQINATGLVMTALAKCEMPKDCLISVIMGLHAPWLNHIRSLALDMPCATQVFVNVNNMAQIMAESDLVIGAAGSTSWERCCLGVPTLIMAVSENQRGIASALKRAGAAISIEIQKEEDFNILFKDKMQNLINNSDERIKMSIAAAKVTNGLGAELVVSEMLNK
jgi:UDP-2,4-diacetamido-2,4,6-trideoxy-beta-L-altropyranose hydrolase